MSIDKSSSKVRAMFSDIAPTYDVLNHLLSGYQDTLWRRRAVSLLAPRRGECILDLCCGTGDLTFAIRRHQPACRVFGADFAVSMLLRAREKGVLSHKSQLSTSDSQLPALKAQHSFTAADALRLPFASGAFDAVTVAFGVRNFEDTRAGLEEIARVLKAPVSGKRGGRLLVLEFMRPDNAALMRFFGGFNVLLSPIGRAVSGHPTAYSYLPQSVDGFCTRRELAGLLLECGFADPRRFEHSGGVATTWLARKA